MSDSPHVPSQQPRAPAQPWVLAGNILHISSQRISPVFFNGFHWQFSVSQNRSHVLTQTTAGRHFRRVQQIYSGKPEYKSLIRPGNETKAANKVLLLQSNSTKSKELESVTATRLIQREGVRILKYYVFKRKSLAEYPQFWLPYLFFFQRWNNN